MIQASNQKTFQYAISIFLQFILDTGSKSINVNGKSFRIFSGLRTEMMQWYIKTQMALGDAAASGNVAEDPLSLAESLCTRLVAAPIKEIVHDEDDDAVISNLSDSC